ncbi:MAG TPA: PQQ-dependent sugar dehydrogenase [Anaerolineae bacterium]
MWLVAALLLICLVGVLAYWVIGRQVDLSGVIGSGDVADVSVPPGFAVDVFAQGLNGPRFMDFGLDGVLYVAERGNDRIVALPDGDGDGAADSVRVFADNLDGVHSVAFHEGAWFAGIPSGVVRLEDSDGDGTADSRTVLIDDYPTGGAHNTRTVAFLPDGRMVVSVGSSCNNCEEEEPRRAAALVYDGPQASGEQLFATGLRNAVGLAVHPQTGELWATDNGRDFMGDDKPPDTIYILRQGQDYGWPYCHSGRILDPELGFAGACDGVELPVVEIQAHSAPLGLVFYEGTSFPAEYQGDLFVAYHGSWNRSEPTGYKVVHLPLEGSQPAGQLEDFATGWLKENGRADGRPVGLAAGPDGALYVSDDKGGFVYRISYTGE